jgi:integrase
MSLRLYPPGTRGIPFWSVRGQVKGRRIERSTGARDRRQAELKLAEWTLELQAEATHGRRPTFAEAAVAYLRDGGEGRYLPPILTYLGAHELVDEVTPQRMAEVAQALKPGVAHQTRRRCIITPMRAVVEHHRRGGRRRPQGDAPRTRWLTPEEAEALILAATPQARRIILTLLGTGLRTSELVGLQAQHVNRATGQLWIADPKNGHPRWVTPEPARALGALLEGLPAEGAALRTARGEAYRLRPNASGGQFVALFNPARAAAGLGPDVTPHTLRHTWATWFYASNLNLPSLMAQGGWLSVSMALRYTKLAPANLPARLAEHGWDFGTRNAGGTASPGLPPHSRPVLVSGSQFAPDADQSREAG